MGLKTDIELREATNIKLKIATEENRVLSEKYEQEQIVQMETATTLAQIKSSLQVERNLRQDTEDELTAASEVNRDLENRLELEQNTLLKKMRELKNIQSKLNESDTTLNQTSQSLNRVQGELLGSQSELEEIMSEVGELRKELRSLRKLGARAWMVSKARVRRRFGIISSRLRRNKSTMKGVKDSVEDGEKVNFQ